MTTRCSGIRLNAYDTHRLQDPLPREQGEADFSAVSETADHRVAETTHKSVLKPLRGSFGISWSYNGWS